MEIINSNGLTTTDKAENIAIHFTRHEIEWYIELLKTNRGSYYKWSLLAPVLLKKFKDVI